mmetsp:Transcript_15261/g.45880  ORF Transcript_15261/g.45880 Transcript_15261/m.45880 type:complete len:418 (+) Transcript_15261:267-1520(+)
MGLGAQGALLAGPSLPLAQQLPLEAAQEAGFLRSVHLPHVDVLLVDEEEAIRVAVVVADIFGSERHVIVVQVDVEAVQEVVLAHLAANLLVALRERLPPGLNENDVEGLVDGHVDALQLRQVRPHADAPLNILCRDLCVPPVIRLTLDAQDFLLEAREPLLGSGLLVLGEFARDTLAHAFAQLLAVGLAHQLALDELRGPVVARIRILDALLLILVEGLGGGGIPLLHRHLGFGGLAAQLPPQPHGCVVVAALLGLGLLLGLRFALLALALLPLQPLVIGVLLQQRLGHGGVCLGKLAALFLILSLPVLRDLGRELLVVLLARAGGLGLLFGGVLLLGLHLQGDLLVLHLLLEPARRREVLLLALLDGPLAVLLLHDHHPVRLVQRALLDVLADGVLQHGAEHAAPRPRVLRHGCSS